VNNNDSDFDIQFFYLDIPDFGDQRFVVAKLRRVTSSPTQEGSSRESMIGRLADIFRLGKASRNYTDLERIKWLLAEQFQTDPDTEWAQYEQVVCRALGMEWLEPIAATVPLPTNGKVSDLSVTFHEATMNDLPYLVARAGSIMGSPAPIYLTLPNQVESALARLRDVFKIGVQGQVFKDFAEKVRTLGRNEQEVMGEWRDCQNAAMQSKNSGMTFCGPGGQTIHLKGAI
jgi:hypothetical protein